MAAARFDMDRETGVGMESFDKVVAAAWDRFEETFRVAVAGLGEGSHFAVVAPYEPDKENDDHGAASYLQIARRGDQVRAEVASNTFLTEAMHLSEVDEQRLVALGWQQPVGETRPNWWYDAELAEIDVVVSMSLGTLRAVLGVVHPRFLASEHLWPPTPRGRTIPPKPKQRQFQIGSPTDRDDLLEMVTRVLAHPSAPASFIDDDGDFAISIGATPIWVRVREDRAALTVFSFLATEIPEQAPARREVDILNRAHEGTQFYYAGDSLIASREIVALPFVARHLLATLKTMAGLVDSLAPDAVLRLDARPFLDLGRDEESA